jgi:hypothetical protein
MAEPILGQALALQSEFRPDTTQVLTRAVDKIGNVTLKKQLAEAKAAEAKAKRQQEIAGMVKLDGVKVNTHYAQDVKDIVSNSYAKMIEAEQRGDGIAVSRLKTEAQIELQNKVQQSEDQEKFKALEQQGFYIPEKIKTALSMSRPEAQKYLTEIFKTNPEYQTILNFDQYGNYAYKPVKNLDLNEEFQKTIKSMDNLYVPTGTKTVDPRTRRQSEVYEIPETNLRTEAKMISQNPDVFDIVNLKHKPELEAIVGEIKKANPNIDNAQAVSQGVEEYVFRDLMSRRKKIFDESIPKGKSGLEMNFGSGFKTASGWIVTPTSGTRVKEEDPTLIDRLKVLNTARRKAGQKTLTYQEAYGTPEADYDEIYFENKDVPENKTFKIPDGKGGFFDMIPVAVRRQSGVDKKTNKDFPWKLSGRIPKTEDEEERNVSIELTPDVVAKLDGILGASTRDIINEVQGKKSAPKIIRQGTPAPAPKGKKKLPGS